MVDLQKKWNYRVTVTKMVKSLVLFKFLATIASSDTFLLLSSSLRALLTFTELNLT